MTTACIDTVSLDSTVELRGGVEMPRFGYGAYRLDDDETGYTAVRAALDAGYRHLDTASVYGNEETLGRALRDSGVPREQVFVTSKAWRNELGRDETPAALDASLTRLGVDHLDLYLIHWPVDEVMRVSWEALIAARETGRVRAIGVSNFTVERLATFDRLCGDLRVPPAVNQVECHCFWQQRPLREDCRERGTLVTGYCPLARGAKIDHPTLRQIAERHDKTPVQVMLRWSVQSGVPAIPKSSDPGRIRDNADLFGFRLDEQDMQRLDALDGTYEANTWRPSDQPWY
jgi:diketogulonate reductase-like aldo/keto reductase